MSAQCKSCGAPLRWELNPRTGRMVPISIATGRNHFQDCPDASRWGRRAPPPPPPPPSTVLDPVRAAKARDEGIAQSSAAQERRDPTWADRMADVLRVVAAGAPELISDDVWAAAEALDPTLIHGSGVRPKALGAVFLAAARAGVIARSGRSAISRYATRHLALTTVWRSLIYTHKEKL